MTANTWTFFQVEDDLLVSSGAHFSTGLPYNMNVRFSSKFLYDQKLKTKRMEIIFLSNKRKRSVHNLNIPSLTHSKGRQSVGNEISVFPGGKVSVSDKTALSVNLSIRRIWVKDI